MPRTDLDARAFQQSAVWTFDTDSQHLIPLDVCSGRLPTEQTPLFVAAKLRTASGRNLDGYVVVSGARSVYAIGVVSDGFEAAFNSRLPHAQPSQRVSLHFGLSEDEDLFPLTYECEFAYPGGQVLRGTFERPSR